MKVKSSVKRICNKCKIIRRERDLAALSSEHSRMKERAELLGLELEQMDQEEAEIGEVRRLVERHLEHASSSRARQVLDDWTGLVPKFVKVIPRDYQRMLAAIARAEEQGLVGDEAIMVAFEQNARDLARVGGN